MTNWLRRTTSHRCIDQSRQQKYRPRVGLEAAPEPSIAPGYGDPMLSGMLDRLIQALPDRPRIIVILRYQEEMEPSEIAAMLNIPVGTVKSVKMEPDKNFLEISVKLSTDFGNLNYVYIVNNIRKEEIQLLDSITAK